MTVIGLDLSLRAPGYFRYQEYNGTLSTDSGTFDVGKSKDFPRMNKILGFVLDLLPEDARSGIDTANILVVIEGFSFSSRGQAVYEIGGIGYLVRFALWKRGIRFIDVPPASLKKFITGTGNADKNIVLREVYKRWNFEAKDDNEADAFGLGRIGMYVSEILSSSELTKFQIEVLNKLR